MSSSISSSDVDLVTPEDYGIGLSDVNLSLHRRKMLDLINHLHMTGLVFSTLHVLSSSFRYLVVNYTSVQMDMDLPMIAVIGSQSAGKSSLIESISGITLPRSAGTCTRQTRAHFIFRDTASDPFEGVLRNANFHTQKRHGNVLSSFTSSLMPQGNRAM
jgi:ABC-type polysaccharide/polyol phosphate transport system ATPase subunit